MPNRIIKESICTSETIDRMSWFEECFYTRLWTACDDYGRMDARPAILKSRLFPLKERLSLKDINDALYKLADIGCVRLYECDSKPYLYLPAWEVHQSIRAKKSKFPAPDTACEQLSAHESICKQMISDESKCPSNPIQSESESESEDEDEIGACAREEVAAVVAVFQERTGAWLSASGREELAEFLAVMDRECCLRAFDAAVDAGKPSWAYVRGVLRQKREQGVRCLEDWDRAEAEWEQGRKAGKTIAGTPKDVQPSPERVKKNAEWLEKFLKEQDGADEP